MRINYFKLLKMTKEEFVDKLSEENINSSPEDRTETLSWESTWEYFHDETNIFKYDFFINFEFPVPFCGERIDCIIEATDKLYIIEFKQWSTNDSIKWYDEYNVQYFNTIRRNPFSQVIQYCLSLFNENEDIKNSLIKIKPIVILPNYDFSIGSLKDATKEIYYERCLIFDKNNKIDFNELLSIENKPVLPLDFTNLATIEEMIKNNKIPNINDEHRIFNQIISCLNKNVDVIVTGTAGSGKTIMALCLLNAIIEYQKKSGDIRNIKFASSNGNQKPILYGASQELVKYLETKLLCNKFNSVFKTFWNCVNNKTGSSILIFDESQRMTLEQVKIAIKNKKELETQIIWFIDETQSIEVGEDNSVSNLLNEYISNNYSCKVLKLENQFRCNGDIDYVKELKKMIETLDGDIKNFPVFATNDINEALSKFESYPIGKRGILYTDAWKSGKIEIGNFCSQSLNEFGEWQSDVKDTPASVFKAQGNQKEYILFLWGRDFVIRNNKWFIQKENVRNKKWSDYYNNNMPLLHSKMKAIIYVLMTRHNKELIVYFDDNETYNYFQSRIKKIGEK